MKKFKFRLQTVLELKSKILDEKLIELSKILSQINTEKEVLNELEMKQKSLNETVLNVISNSSNIDVEQVINLKNYLPKLDDKIKSQHQLICDMKNVLELKQDEVNAAYRDKEILEKLKEKQKNLTIKNLKKLKAMNLMILQYQDIVFRKWKFNRGLY
ncbi:MAG: flagellar export protein FliJ [Candidatus Melainabacteria bacterium]|nr:MAG: flagellar export protein FliJ [Candidatus Melainabacteria bacterium]